MEDEVEFDLGRASCDGVGIVPPCHVVALRLLRGCGAGPCAEEFVGYAPFVEVERAPCRLVGDVDMVGVGCADAVGIDAVAFWLELDSRCRGE